MSIKRYFVGYSGEAVTVFQHRANDFIYTVCYNKRAYIVRI